MEDILRKFQKRRIGKFTCMEKKKPKQKRKMGHVTFLRNSVEEALEEIEQSNIW